MSTTIALNQMTPEEQNAYYDKLGRLIEDGYTRKQIQEMFDLSEQAARRHIIRARAHMQQTRALVTVQEEPSFPAIAARQIQVAIEPEDKAKLKGGRVSRDAIMRREGQVVAQPESGDWRLDTVAPESLRRMTPADLLPKLIRQSPELSRAHYDFLRMANPGWDLKAKKPNGKQVPSPEGQEYLDWCVRQMSRRNGSVEVVFNAILSNLAVRGALLCEMVLENDARTFANIVVPDAYLARFKVVKDKEYGGFKYQLIQQDGRDEIILDRPTIKYIPLDPLPDSPYGTSMLSPGLFPAIFLITMLHDARRVVAQQGWPRLDILVDVAKIVAGMSPKDQQNPQTIQAYVKQAVEEVANSYSKLDPDQAWVHSDTVTFGQAIGAIGELDGIDSLVSVLERMAVRALKSQPLLFGIPEGVSEANANRQWEVHIQGIQAVQGLAQEALSSLFTLALEAKGIAAVAEFKFHELRAMEELRDAQVMFQKLENAQRAELLGYMEHDEASNYAVGHPAAATPIGVVGDEEDQPEDDEDGSTDNPESGAVMEGDTGDEDPPKGDDGASLAAPTGKQPWYSERNLRLLESVLGAAGTAEGVAMGMAILSGRVAPEKIKPQGTPEYTGNEDVTVGTSDLSAAKADFNYRVAPEFVGILDATPLDKPEGSD